MSRIEETELKRLREFMDSTFKFKVGDVVQPSTLGDYADVPSGYHMTTVREHSWGEITIAGSTKHRYQIVERWLQECHGGVQKHYRIQLSTKDGAFEPQVITVMEHQIAVSAPYKRLRGMKRSEFQKWLDSTPDERFEPECPLE